MPIPHQRFQNLHLLLAPNLRSNNKERSSRLIRFQDLHNLRRELGGAIVDCEGDCFGGEGDAPEDGGEAVLEVREEEGGGFVDEVEGHEESESDEEGEEHSCEEAGAASSTAEGGGPSEEVGGVGHGRVNGTLLGGDGLMESRLGSRVERFANGDNRARAIHLEMIYCSIDKGSSP